MQSQPPQNPSTAEYQRHWRKTNNTALKEFKRKRFERLVKNFEEIKPLLKKYRPDYVPPPDPDQLKKQKEKTPPRRKRWILGVD
jgi:hypothetical protein